MCIDSSMYKTCLLLRTSASQDGSVQPVHVERLLAIIDGATSATASANGSEDGAVDDVFGDLSCASGVCLRDLMCQKHNLSLLVVSYILVQLFEVQGRSFGG